VSSTTHRHQRTVQLMYSRAGAGIHGARDEGGHAASPGSW